MILYNDTETNYTHDITTHKRFAVTSPEIVSDVDDLPSVSCASTLCVMPLAAQPPLVEAPELQVGVVVRFDIGGLVAHEALALDGGHIDAADA